MADIDLQSLGQRLGEAITPTPRDAPQVRYGTIDAVNADGTLDVTIDGTTLRGMCATTGCVGAQAGMRCVVLRQGALATVVGLVANSSLGGIRLPNDGRIESTSAADPADWHNLIAWIGDTIHVGNGTYNQQTGKTSVYGNEVHLISRSGVRVDGHYIPLGNVSKWYSSSNTAVTTTSSVTLGSVTHTSQTGKVLVFADMMLKTSANTSTMRIFQGSTQLSSNGTNITTPVRITRMFDASHTRGAELTYSLRMYSQNTSTTATFPSYNSAELVIIDI